ncbi:MAG TPA: alpha/beta hydrolase [Bryobacteraceae bacterium]|nr:alpha/beta hydrolase [Bryobacteraceae bacterium]
MPFFLMHAAEPPPTGELVDVGGRRLHLDCKGSGSPTVVVENGGGSFSVEWALFQPEIAKHTRICTYDRAGYAWSDPGPVVDGIEQITDDLRLLLRTARIQPPYVFVGASLGCIYARAYQRRSPEDVAGLVFVDGTHDEGISFMWNKASTPISLLSREQLATAHADYLRAAPKPAAGPADAYPLSRLPKDLQSVRHWALQKLILEVGRLPNSLAAAESWRQEFTALRRQRLASGPPLGALPLVVLERSDGADESFHAKQAQLAGLSSAGQLIKAERSGHMIHLYRPDLVIEAIRNVVAACQKKH